MGQRNVVFISYSHTHEKFAEELKTQLDVGLATNPEIEVFLDSDNIEPGQRWDQTIREKLEATAVGVFLFSASLLKSRYVREVEIAEIHAAWKRGDAACLPLWTAPVAGLTPGVVVGPNEATWVVRLGDFQGLNDPREPLSSLKAPMRMQVIADAATAIIKEARKRVPAGHRSSLRESPAPTSTGPLASRFTTVDAGRLTIVAERVGRDHRLTYRDAAGRDFHTTAGPANAPLPLRNVNVQFARLFPGGTDGGAWRAVAQRYGGDLNVTPAGLTGLEIRVVTQDVDYLIDRYGAPQWNGIDLSGESDWTIYFARDDYAGPVDVKIPANFVLTSLVADRTGAHNAMRHVRTVAQELESATGTTCEIRFAYTKAEALSDLKARPPHAVYVVGSAIDHRIEFSDGRLDFSEMAHAFIHRPPQFAFFNVGHTGRSDGLLLGCQELSRTVPLVVLVDEMDFESGSRTLYELLLRDGGHVVRRARKEKAGSKSGVWWSGKSYATPQTRELVARRRIAKRLLDRTEAKGSVSVAIERDLLKESNRSVVALLAFGREGAMVEAFGEQVFNYLNDGDKFAGIRRVVLRLEQTETWTSAALLYALCDAYGCERVELKEQLDKAARKTATDGRIPLLLDFGPRGTPGVPRLQAEDLQAWAAFCRDELPQYVPSGLAMAALLSVQVFEPPEKLRAAADRLANPPLPRFRLRTLPELGHVPANELADYLISTIGKERWEYPKDRTKDVGRVAQHLVEVSKDDHGAGQFQSLVAEIEHIEALGWATFFSTFPSPPDHGDRSVGAGAF